LADEEFAIARLREALVKLTDDDHSLCQVAGERGIFCHGFRRKRIRLFNPSGVGELRTKERMGSCGPRYRGTGGFPTACQRAAGRHRLRPGVLKKTPRVEAIPERRSRSGSGRR
jgi:hypothetical protein